MKKLRSLICLLVVLVPLCGLNAQELNCQVQVVSPSIQGTTEKRIFDNLQKAMFEFMNNTKWTNDVFSYDERIGCSLFMNITEKVSTDEYKATLQIQSTRPVYKTSYSSVMINHSDNDLQFKYVEFQPFEFSINQNLNNLTSVLAYYAYMIIGEDYDSFSLNGGTQYFQKAQTICANCQNAAEKGWKAFEGTKNRYWLVENKLNQVFSPMREFSYKYHRLAFDVMWNDVNGGRATALEAMQLLKKVHQQRPLSFNMQVLFNAKNDEIVKLFSNQQVLNDEKSKASQLLQEIDPSHGNLYQKILQGG